MDIETRMEKDSLGEVQVPAEAYFGAQTQRALVNFQIGTELFPKDWVAAHALVKKAAAKVNQEQGQLDEKLADAIVQAADEVINGDLDMHFPLVIWQSGSGTQFNMNVNEVIANRASEILGGERGKKEPVHPNDHVNMSQSTNDTVPTSMHIAAVLGIKANLIAEIRTLRETLQKHSEEFAKIVKIGRTHLQDATPLTLGQEFSGYEAQLNLAQEALNNCLPHLLELPVGGTAVGTGLNTKQGYDEAMVQTIGELTGHPFAVARNKFAGMAAHDAIVGASGALKMLAAALMKIANDIRWMASGPRCGFGELVLPPNEPGSSIMPGKVNPTQCEMVTQVACQVFGNDTVITVAGSQGNFELNVFKPVIGNSLLQSIRLLTDACRSFNTMCIAGLVADQQKIDWFLNESLMLVTALNRHIGYDKAAVIALKAYDEGTTLKDAAVASGHLTAEQFDQWVQPEKMLGPSD